MIQLAFRIGKIVGTSMNDVMTNGETSDDSSAHCSAGDAKISPGANGQQRPPSVSRGLLLTLVVVLLIVAVIVGVIGVLQRVHAKAEIRDYTDANAPPPVLLVKPELEQSAREIVLPGNIQAFAMAPIYARTTGYVRAWYHDIGSHVKKGDLLAVIETPELDQQLAQAKADVSTAESNAALAKVTADRYQGLVAQNAVSQQETDNAAAQLRGSITQVTSAQANVKRLEELQAFERIEAPFDGVITARNLDVGQLVTSAGSTMTPGSGTLTGNKEIFDVAAVQTLRVFINVPQVNSPDAKNGVRATLVVPQYPGKTYPGKLVRSSNSVDPATRTLLAEVDVDNRSGELLPGSYAEVHLNVSSGATAWMVPISALIFEPDGLHLATVDSTHHAHIVRVIPGRDTGTTMEILNGIEPGQMIISNPPDSLTDGEVVRVVTPEADSGKQSTGLHQ
jgi:RND family efflux transporter MFP subunit